MELKHNDTLPSTRSTLKFSKTDVIAALKEYATKQGYRFSENKVSVWFPSDRPHPDSENLTTLVVDCSGTKHGIAKISIQAISSSE